MPRRSCDYEPEPGAYDLALIAYFQVNPKVRAAVLAGPPPRWPRRHGVYRGPRPGQPQRGHRRAAGPRVHRLLAQRGGHHGDVDPDGWLHTGDIGSLDDEGFLRVTGRKKELIVTAGGKNVAPAVLEDRLRAHPLISQCMVVGDDRPFVACLVTLDEEALGAWKQQHGKPADATAADLREDPELIAEIQAAVDDANKAVSRAESIRKFRMLPVDFTKDNGYLTPSLKVSRCVVAKDFAADIEALYA